MVTNVVKTAEAGQSDGDGDVEGEGRSVREGLSDEMTCEHWCEERGGGGSCHMDS